MLISIKHDFVVLLTPKCASNSIEDSLLAHSDIVLRGVPALRHTDYRTYNLRIKPYLLDTVQRDDLETICVIRNPLAWLNSHYRFKSRLEIRKERRERASASTYGISFRQFVEAFMSSEPPAFARFRTQFDFVKTDTGEIGINRIFLYENIADFFEYMGSKIGARLDATYKNVSPRRGTEKNLSAWADYARRKISTRISWLKQMPEEKTEFELSEDVVLALRQFIPDDFELYERVKRESASTIAASRVRF